MQTWQIGDVRVTKIVELEVTGGTRFILPHATPETCRLISWMAPHFMDGDGRLKMSIHALLVETPSRRIIDGATIRVSKSLASAGPGRISRWFADGKRSMDTIPCASVCTTVSFRPARRTGARSIDAFHRPSRITTPRSRKPLV